MMKHIDYTNYTLEQLLECQEHIDKTKSPENSLALEIELASRDYEGYSIPEITEAEKKEELKIAEKRVKIIGYFQLLGSALIAYFLFVGSNQSTINISVGIAFILLNLVSGITAIKEMYGWYWLSILNQGLQILNLSIGKYIINYSAIGGIYTGLTWRDGEFGINFTLSLTPGFTFYQLTEVLSKNLILIDVLAVVFFAALVTVKDKKLKPENN